MIRQLAPCKNLTANRIFYTLGALACDLMKAVQLLCLPAGMPWSESYPLGGSTSCATFDRRGARAVQSPRPGSFNWVATT